MFQEDSWYNPLQPLPTNFSKDMMPRQSMEVLPLFAVQDAWNKLPTADPGAVLTLYEGGEAQGVVPEDGLGCLNDVENKAGGSGEQHSFAREGPLTPPSF
jgi:hypothetical protein